MRRWTLFSVFDASLTASALLLFGSLGTGCGQLWGNFSEAEADNCYLFPYICAADQHCNRMTQACEQDADLFPPPTSPTSFISPGGLGGMVNGLTYPRDVRYVLDTPLQATIYYTLDGSTPTPGQSNTRSGTTPLSLNPVPTGSQVTWYADYGPTYSTSEGVHSFLTTTDPTMIDSANSITEKVIFNSSGGPGVVVKRGEPLGLTLNFQAWANAASSSCPTCQFQYVVSVPTVGAIGCVDNIQNYGPYPGQGNVLIIPYFNAPAMPGRFPLIGGLTSSSSCDGTVSTTQEIGEIYVK